MIKFRDRVSAIFSRKREGFVPFEASPDIASGLPPLKKSGPPTGFTLIELLVVLVVISVLSSLLIVYNHTSRQQVALYVDEAKIVQIILRAKSLSLSTYRESPSEPEICGYGIHIDYGNNSYTLFSYEKPDKVACQAIKKIDPTLQQPVSSFFLNKELAFTTAKGGKGGTKIDDVIFIPPDPITFINSEGGPPSMEGSIILKTQDGSAEATVTVSPAGQITF